MIFLHDLAWLYASGFCRGRGGDKEQAGGGRRCPVHERVLGVVRPYERQAEGLNECLRNAATVCFSRRGATLEQRRRKTSSAD